MYQGSFFELTNSTPAATTPVDQTGAQSGIASNPLRIDPTGTTTQPVSGTVTTTPPANASTNITEVGGAALSEGQKTSAASIPVVIASDQSSIAVTSTPPTPPSTATLTNVASSATSVSILASQVGRKKFFITNLSTSSLYLAFAATASPTAFTILLPAGGSYESALYDYTGAISGIWSSANGFAYVTEVTA